MKTRVMVLITTACAVAAIAAPASSSPVLITYSGTVSSGYDYAGQFGTAQAALDGQSFIASYLFDPAKGGNTVSTDSFTDTSGGSVSGSVSPLISATLTIGNHTVNLPGGYSDRFENVSLGDFGYQYSSVYSILNGPGYEFSDLDFTTAGNGFIIPATFSDYSSDVGPSSGLYQFLRYGSDLPSEDVYATLNPNHLSISVSAVPEPATWVMMLAGFGMIGSAARRRSKVKTAVTFA